MVQLPEEIIRHILEYNVNHRILFKPTLERIATAAALMKYHVINNAWNKIILEGVELPFPDFLMSSKYIINFDEYVKALDRCDCCERHKTNRPTHFYDSGWNVHTPAPPRMAKLNKCKCKCPCRHMSRICCVSTLPEWEPIIN